MRRGILELNAAHRSWLSNDLGAIAGFLFDVGKGRVPLPTAGDNAAARAAWATDLAQVRADAADLRLRAIEAEIGRATSELKSIMRISYADFCLKKKNTDTTLP